MGCCLVAVVIMHVHKYEIRTKTIFREAYYKEYQNQCTNINVKRVGGLQNLERNKFTYLNMHLSVLFS